MPILIDLSERISEKELLKPVKDVVSEFEFVFGENSTIEQVLYILQSKPLHRHIESFYVINEDQLLVGLIAMKDLLYYTPSTLLGEILEKDIVKVLANESLEKALKKLAQQRVLILPVVDENNHFIGVLEVTPKETTSTKSSKEKDLKEDLFQYIGFSLEQGKSSSLWKEFRCRMPWLGCNLVGGLICAVIGEVFKLALVQYVVLALFIPLVLTLSESISIQAMTLSLRFMHLRKILVSQIAKRIFSEWKTSALLGIASAIIIGCFYFAWSIEMMPVVSISISLIVSMIASATFGALMPIMLHLLNLDPKVAAGPVALMMADIITITIYLGLSTILLVR